MKKIIAIFICAIFVLSSQSAAFSQAAALNMDGRFSAIYAPPSWSSSALEKAERIISGAAISGIMAYFKHGTLSASAGPVAAWIGGVIGGLKGLRGIAAVKAGLATLGGGSLASGGFGILGGVIVLSVVGDVFISVALDFVTSPSPQKADNSFSNLIKIKMFSRYIDKEAQIVMAELDKELYKSDMNPNKARNLINLIEKILLMKVPISPAKEMAYNWLLLSIISYNNKKFQEAQERVTEAMKFFSPEMMSVPKYVSALIAFGRGRIEETVADLKYAISNEPKAIPPYIILAQIYIDSDNTTPAVKLLITGLHYTGKKDFAMNIMLADVYYESKMYLNAIEHYKIALRGINVRELKALCKLSVAKCYRQRGNAAEAKEWLNGAIKEVVGEPNLIKQVLDEYSRD